MLPNETYLEKDGSQQILAEHDGSESMQIERVQCGSSVVMMNSGLSFWFETKQFPPVKESGIYLYVKGYPFPFKSSPDAQNMFAMNFVKALFVETLKSIDIFALPFLINLALSKNKLQKLIDSFNRIGYKMLSPYYLKDKYISEFSLEFRKLISNIFQNLGIKKESSDAVAMIFMHIFENDNSYNLRLKDIFSTLNKELMCKNPFKELQNIKNTVNQRDRESVAGCADKIAPFVTILRLSTLIPRFKKALIKAFEVVELNKLVSDDTDKYWQCPRIDYKFMGMNKEKRMEYAKSRGWNYPKAFY